VIVYVRFRPNERAEYGPLEVIGSLGVAQGQLSARARSGKGFIRTAAAVQAQAQEKNTTVHRALRSLHQAAQESLPDCDGTASMLVWEPGPNNAPPPADASPLELWTVRGPACVVERTVLRRPIAPRRKVGSRTAADPALAAHGAGRQSPAERPQGTPAPTQPKGVRLHLPMDFGSTTAALEWFDGLRRSGSIPAEAELYVPDAVDRERHGYGPRDLIVRRAGDRPWGRVRDELTGRC
jgi:hypothetical protein